MSQYNGFSREQLIRRIEELENGSCTVSSEKPEKNFGWFRGRYADKILDSIPDMLTIFTPDGTIADLVSSEETNHSGLPVEEMLGKNMNAILTPPNARNIKTNLDHVFASGHWSQLYLDITLGDHTHYYENRIFPLDSEYALCMCRDITAERLAQQELETVKYAMNNVDEEIYACDLDGRMIYANELFRRRNNLLGDLLQCVVYELWLPIGTRSQWTELVGNIRREKGTHKYTVRFKNDQDRIVAWDIAAYIAYDEFRDKEIVWFFGHDVTMRISHENKLKEMNTLLHSILNNIPVYLFVKDPGNEFRYLYWNAAFEEFSHIPASKALGHTDYEIFPNLKDAEKFRRDDLELLRNGERISFIEDYVTQTGEHRVVSTSKALVSMENRLPLIIGVSWDITDRKRVEEEVVKARIKAEESDKLKSAFLANMSHEIRTPLNAIVGFSKLISESETEEEKQQYAEIIDSNSELLLQLINDILDISKIEAGILEFKYKNMEVNELCRGEYEMFRARMPEGVELIFDKKYDHVNIECDQNRLSQVLTNLLTNATKFTPKGEIRFGFDVRDDMLDFYVQDTGVGIASEKLTAIFTRFIKLNNFAVGTGLGLSISKMIVEKMGGHISVESEYGNGSCFRFSIPRRQSGRVPEV